MSLRINTLLKRYPQVFGWHMSVKNMSSMHSILDGMTSTKTSVKHDSYGTRWSNKDHEEWVNRRFGDLRKWWSNSKEGKSAAKESPKKSQ